jgi:DNA-binding NarL/FixJ family response regulator
VDPVTAPIRVVVVDDDPLLRSGLRMMLGGHDDLEVVGVAGDGREGVAMVEELRPTVVLMDIRMPRMDGLEATRALMSRPYPPRVIVLTTFDADELVVAALGIGADGFLLKDTAPERIVEAIRRVADGDPMLSPSAARSLLDQLRSDSAPDRERDALRLLDTLTEREREVALAIGRGLSNAEVATELHLSVTTVKGYTGVVFTKLGATNRTQVAITVHDAGLGG